MPEKFHSSFLFWKGYENMEKQTLQKLGLLCASVALCSAASWWSGNEDADRQVQKMAEQPVVEQVQDIKITVCVSGAVVKPGLYEVTKGSRAQQVIELAGGVTEDADMDRVNLAQLCKDGGHIKVPRLSKARLKQKRQERKIAAGTVISGEMTGSAYDNPQKKSEEVSETADNNNPAATRRSAMQPDGTRSREQTGTNAADGVLVHLNSATETELIRLPGVGNATARRIISFRNQHGFQRIEDIMQVPGIGPAKFAKMKNCLAL